MEYRIKRLRIKHRSIQQVKENKIVTSWETGTKDL